MTGLLHFIPVRDSNEQKNYRLPTFLLNLDRNNIAKLSSGESSLCTCSICRFSLQIYVPQTSHIICPEFDMFKNFCKFRVHIFDAKGILFSTEFYLSTLSSSLKTQLKIVCPLR